MNAYLDNLHAKVYEAYRRLVAGQVPVSAESIKNNFPGREEKGKMLLGIFQEHNRKMAVLVGDEFAPGALERYATSLRHTQAFLQWKYNLPDIDIRKIAWMVSPVLYLTEGLHTGFVALM